MLNVWLLRKLRDEWRESCRDQESWHMHQAVVDALESGIDDHMMDVLVEADLIRLPGQVP